MTDPQLHVNLMRLGERERAELLRRLDPVTTPDGRCADHERRREPRWIFRRSDIVAEMDQPGGGVSRFLVLARNLSANGMAFIHGGFVYPKTRAQFLLPRVDGPSQLVRGSVVGCRHVGGPLHEVRVRFDQSIDPKSFLHPDQLTDGLAVEASMVRNLAGRVLLLSGEPETLNAVTHALSPTEIELTHAESVHHSRMMLSRRHVDLILLDLEDDRERAIRTVDELRRVDLDPPLAVLTRELQESFMTAVSWEGADYVLGKPLDARELYEVLIQLHRQRRAFVA
ncbi:MAG: response regulator [Planctomycetota bacterium]|jgi:CheY-like chemotaxis protein